jgi:hypothetical protein
VKKIVALTSDNRDLNFRQKLGYLEYCALINKRYFSNYNVKFFFLKIENITNSNLVSKKDCVSGYARKVLSPKAASWTKLLAIYSFFKSNYDYILYLDSDCIVNNHKIKPSSLIKNLHNKQALFYSDQPWNSTLPNCGFILMKNNNYNKVFIKNWWNTFSKKNLSHPYEQHWLQSFWKDNKKKVNKNFKLVNENICRLVNDKQYIFHMTSDFRNQNKNNFFFKKYIQKNRIKFNNIRNAIKNSTIKINTNNIDREISGRKFFLYDYIFIYLANNYLIIKNYLFIKPIIFIRSFKFAK